MRKMPCRERLDDEGDSKLRVEAASQKLGVVRRGAHLDTTTTRCGSAKRNAAFTLQHGAMLTTRQPEGCVPVVVSRCAPWSSRAPMAVSRRAIGWTAGAEARPAVDDHPLMCEALRCFTNQKTIQSWKLKRRS